MFAFLRIVLKPVTVPDLVAEYFCSQEYRSLSASSQQPYRRVIQRISAELGNRPVRSITRRHVEELLALRSPGAANDALKKIRVLMRLAMDRGYRRDDPASGIRRFAAGAGHHSWSESEIGQFEQHWPIGTRERVAFGLLLYSGQRKSDVAKMSWEDLTSEGINVVQRKTGARLIIPIHRDLRSILATLEPGTGPILRTTAGKPFSDAGFGNWMALKIGFAGLPDRCVTHGLRKAAARRLAEAGCSTREVAAITGHVTLREIECYTKGADQARLARRAMARISGETCS